MATVSLSRSRRLGPFGERDNIQQFWESFISTATRNICFPNGLMLAPTACSSHKPPSGSSAIPVGFETPRFEVIDDAAVSSDESPRMPKQESLEVEMTRMVFTHHLTRAIAAAREALCTSDTPGAQPSTSDVLCDQAIAAKAVDVQQLVAATYQCDFGNIIAGSTKKKVFKVTNSSSAGVISWSFDVIGMHVIFSI